MATSTYPDKPLNNELFAEQLGALALPGTPHVDRPLQPDGSYVITIEHDLLTAAQQTALDGLLARHDFTERTTLQQAADAAIAANAQADAGDAEERGNFPALRTQMTSAETALSTFIARPNPTTANLAALNLVWDVANLLCRIQLVQIRLWRYVITRGLRKGWL